MSHERDAISLDRVSNDDFRRVRIGADSVEYLLHRGEIMTVNSLGLPAERTKLRLEIAEAVDFIDPGIRLDLVVIYYRGDLTKSLIRR